MRRAGYEITDLGRLLNINEYERMLREESGEEEEDQDEPYEDYGTFTLNSLGQVVGAYALDGMKGFHAFRTTPTGTFCDGTAADLGTLGGRMSYGGAMNDLGQTTGISELPDGRRHAFRAGENMEDLETFMERRLFGRWVFTNTSSIGTDINNRGQVVGMVFDGGWIQRAFRTTPTGRVSEKGTDLGTLGGTTSSASGINDSGQVTGDSWLRGNKAMHAFRTTPTGTLADLGTLGGAFSSGKAINARGQITGNSWTGERLESGHHLIRAFRTTATGTLTDGICTDLGTLGGGISMGADINNSGYVVGYSTSRIHKGRYAMDSGCHAFLYTDQMIDLNTLLPENSGWELLYAHSINDQEQISGIGMLNGQKHAFRMTPIIPYAKRQQILALRDVLEVKIQSQQE